MNFEESLKLDNLLKQVLLKMLIEIPKMIKD